MNFTETQLDMVRLKQEGFSSRHIAKLLGVGKSTVNDTYNRYLNSAGEPTGDLNEVAGAKVLFLDLEVSASIVAAFSMFKHFSTPDHVIQFPYILTYAANWLHEDTNKIECLGLDDFDTFEKDHRNDYELVVRLWKLLDEADIVVGQNLARFDDGWFNQRAAYHNLPPPSPYRVIDTLMGLKKAMALPSNSLGYSTKYFDLPHKKLHNEGISLWIRCMDGDEEAFSMMKIYNVGDIPTLRELYLKIRAFIPNHPNVALYFGNTGETMRCPVCGSEHLEKLEGKAYTNLSIFDAYRCGNCGTVKRSGVSDITSKQRKNYLRNISKL
jgi:transposase-like protein